MGNAAPEGPCQGDYLWKAHYSQEGSMEMERALLLPLCQDMVGASTLVIVLFGNCLPLPLDCGLCFIFVSGHLAECLADVVGQ